MSKPTNATTLVALNGKALSPAQRKTLDDARTNMRFGAFQFETAGNLMADAIAAVVTGKMDVELLKRDYLIGRGAATIIRNASQMPAKGKRLPEIIPTREEAEQMMIAYLP